LIQLKQLFPIWSAKFPPSQRNFFCDGALYWGGGAIFGGGVAIPPPQAVIAGILKQNIFKRGFFGCEIGYGSKTFFLPTQGICD